MARTLGAGRNSSILSTCWFLTSTPFLIFSFEPNVDTLFVAFYLIAVHFFLDHLRQECGHERGICWADWPPESPWEPNRSASCS